MEFGGRDLHEFVRSPVLAALKQFHVRNDNIRRGGMGLLLRRDVPRMFTDVAFSSALSDPDTARTIACSPVMSGVRRLDLSHNPIGVLQQWSQSKCLDDLQSLNLAHYRLRGKELGKLVVTGWWFNLVELDLSGNALSESALTTLNHAEPPTDLVALRLCGNDLSRSFRAKLQDHFRGAVVFDDIL